MDKGAIDDTGKSTNSRLVHNGSSWSMTAAHEIQDEENLVHKQNKEDEIRDNLVLPVLLMNEICSDWLPRATVID